MPQKLRPDIDEYFLKIAKVVSERSTCIRRKVGAVVVKNKHILATGYNGAAAGAKDCLELGCLRDQNNIPSGSTTSVCRAIHAEENVIIQAALSGNGIKGATIYCTTSPCSHCARLLVNAGVKRFVCFLNYTNTEAHESFRQAGIELDVLPEPNFDLKKINERVLAVDDFTFKEAGFFTGFKDTNINSFYKKIRSSVRYIDRDDAEVNDEWKQIIPYVLVHKKDKYLVLKRLPKGKEKRLYEAYTFGVGGHINPVDSSTGERGKDVIERGMHREMEEEIDTSKIKFKSIKLVGFVYNESQEVSRHHIGFIYDAEIENNKVNVRETKFLEPFMVAKKDLQKFLNGKESWAEIVYSHYINKK
ncbi:MAG: CMP/dCMP deaminase zinc-binding protein [candidate division CPR2 bacterium GW2011_GWC1_39_9]|uniref:CMP/dCMP deaminase zinc-binding protein n=1 Tax=candidate division CPR2 bacterium GW2011_GWC2_39_10 TaxID=1618345 RepID=A0A0G0PAT0_UNCC2|nr:MAG: CMP/dCMP deaminase zinc-binding protein [candidate division CPR2 bacterium GW2011_GWC2_39_10]KKR33264.1 MAG: CMP/dCMP deaminase zinc-binding protein [candidate division CPR2 bacterium GW2011_GWC1_39_9]